MDLYTQIQEFCHQQQQLVTLEQEHKETEKENDDLSVNQVDRLARLYLRREKHHEFHEIVMSTLRFIQDCLTTYGESHVAIAFNGGKDCTVLLECLRAVFARLGWDFSTCRIIYFPEKNPFTEVSEFLQETKHRYQLQNWTEILGNIKEKLGEYIQEHAIKAIFMGQRNCDPHVHAFDLAYITPSDNGWPLFDRINPLLDWKYSEIWLFLHQFSLPFCSLYAKGFTSIGDRTNSVENPALWDADSGKFRSAWELNEHECHERNGRQNDQSSLLTKD